MTINPVGRNFAIYDTGRGWTAVLFVASGLPTRAAAERAAESFVSAYVSGFRDGLRDLFSLWLAAKMWTGEMWGPARITDWLRGACERLAPGSVGA